MVCFKVFFEFFFFFSSGSEGFFSLFFRQKKGKQLFFLYLDGVVRGLGEVVAQTGHGAREVERRRRRVHGRADDAHSLERRVGRVLAERARRRDVPIDEGVARRVDDGLGALERPVTRRLEDDALVDVPLGGRVDEVWREDFRRGDDDLGRGSGWGSGELCLVVKVYEVEEERE